jgi:hypothetical protein
MDDKNLDLQYNLIQGVQGSRFKVQGSGFKVQGSGFKVQGSKVVMH